MSQLITLAGTVTISDVVTNNLSLTKILQGLNYTASVSTVGEAVSIGTGSTSIALPISPTQFIYIKNTHATQTLLITWTPTGGSSVAGPVLQPGAAIILIESNVTSGITALALTGSGAGTICEYILAG